MLLLTFAQYIIEVLIRLETYVTLEQIIWFNFLRLLLVRGLFNHPSRWNYQICRHLNLQTADKLFVRKG